MGALRGRQLLPKASVRALTIGVPAMAVAGALLLSGCGSSKPEYCVKSTELNEAVSALTKLDLSKEGVSGAEAALRRVDDSATALVNTAKREFPTQTEAISSSAKELAASVKEAENPQQRSSAVSQIPAEIVALGSAVHSFAEATKSKCE